MIVSLIGTWFVYSLFYYISGEAIEELVFALIPFVVALSAFWLGSNVVCVLIGSTPCVIYAVTCI